MRRAREKELRTVGKNGVFHGTNRLANNNLMECGMVGALFVGNSCATQRQQDAASNDIAV